MATLLTVDEVREHIETDLEDAPLTRMLAAADAEIVSRLGAVAAETEVLRGGGALLHLRRKATVITSVVERINSGDTIEVASDDAGWPNPQDYVLAVDDFALLADGFRVERRMGSSYPELAWRGRVTIVYTPADETARRIQLLVDLLKLAIAFSGLSTEDLGNSRTVALDYPAEKEKLFASFQNGGGRRMRLA
jgi:hypothetical protein